MTRVHNPWKKDSDEALRGDSLHLKMKLSSNDLSYFTEKLFCFERKFTKNCVTKQSKENYKSFNYPLG